MLTSPVADSPVKISSNLRSFRIGFAHHSLRKPDLPRYLWQQAPLGCHGPGTSGRAMEEVVVRAARLHQSRTTISPSSILSARSCPARFRGREFSRCVHSNLRGSQARKQTTQRLVCAKSRLAKHNLTIPRLELVSGHMAINLITNIRTVMDKYVVATHC